MVQCPSPLIDSDALDETYKFRTLENYIMVYQSMVCIVLLVCQSLFTGMWP